MEQVIEILQMLPVYLTALIGVLTALIGLFMLVPGEEPEKTLQKVVDFVTKFSKK